MREKYDALCDLGREVERELSNNPTASRFLPIDTQMHQLDALMWTYLRLLRTEERLTAHITRKRREDLDEKIDDLQRKVESLNNEIAELEQQDRASLLATRQRLLDSTSKRLSMLK